MWIRYKVLVLTLYGQGYRVEEIARISESTEELICKVVERYYKGPPQDSSK